MAPRDLRLVEQALTQPFQGYSRRPAWSLAPDLERVVACVALLAAMVLSGLALGATPNPARSRR